MKAKATNEHSKVDGSIAIKTPTITNVYITVGTKTIVKPKKEGDPEKTKVTLDKKYNQGLFGRKYFLVLETKDFPTDSSAKFKISFRSKIKALSEQDTSFKVLLDSTDVESIEMPFNNYFNDDLIENKKDFENKSVIEFAFDRKEDKDRDEYKDLISKTTDKYATTYLHIEEILNEESAIDLNGDATSKDKKDFYFEKTFNLYQECLCNRDMTENELTQISLILYNKLIDIENKKKGTKIKHVSSREILNLRCPIKTEDKSYKRLAEELNQMFSRYNINSCNKKTHFIAQSFLESQSFSTTTEGGGGENYELKNWENKKTNLEIELNSIDRLVGTINGILEKNKKELLNPNKDQIDQLANLVVTDTDKETINEYKSIFEKEWKDNFDNLNTVKYRTKGAYLKAKEVTISKIANIKVLGNTEDGDGPRYKGKGLIQLTWRETYVSYFTYLKQQNNPSDFIKKHDLDYFLDRKNKQELLLNSDLYFSVDSAGWFWDVHRSGLSDYTNYDGDTLVKYPNRKNKIKAIEAVTRKVNGGTNHLKERTAYYELLRDSIFCIKATCINYDEIK